MRSEKRDKIQMMIIMLCTLVFLVCVIHLILYLNDSTRSTRQAKNMKREYIFVTEEQVAPDKNIESESGFINATGEPVNRKVTIDGKEYPDFTGLDVPRRNIDFKSMQSEVNGDIYAWVYVPGTKVDYPVLQNATDDTYYLTHDNYGDKASCGSVYTEKHNCKDFNDNHNVLYGHNMKSGAMFKTLRNYDDKDFLFENKYIYIYTPEDTRVYEIYAAYAYTDEHLLETFNTENRIGFQQYLDKVWDLGDGCGHFDRQMSVNSGDKIITLSTCITGRDNNRYLVQGKLIAVEAN